MTSTMDSLYLLESSPEGGGVCSCEALIVPTEIASSAVQPMVSPVVGWVNADATAKVSWMLHESLVYPIGDLACRARFQALSHSMFSISGKTQYLRREMFIVPSLSMVPMSVDLSVLVVAPSLFHLAGFQSVLRAKQALRSIFGDCPDDCSVELSEIAKRLFLQVGDTLPVIVRGKGNVGGVLLLDRMIAGQEFAARLCFPKPVDSVSSGCELISVSEFQIDGISSRFESQVAVVQAVF